MSVPITILYNEFENRILKWLPRVPGANELSSDTL